MIAVFSSCEVVAEPPRGRARVEGKEEEEKDEGVVIRHERVRERHGAVKQDTTEETGLLSKPHHLHSALQIEHKTCREEV